MTDISSARAGGAENARPPALDDRLVAEQDERRRLGELIHDGPVQHLAAIAQMLDAAAAAAAVGDAAAAHPIVVRALTLTREASGDLRELVSGLEPDALREHGLATAVALLTQRLTRRGIAVEADVEAGAVLGEAAAIGLYQIVRESLDQAVRRGPPTKISVELSPTSAGGVQLEICDNGSGERRQAVLDGLAERAESLNAAFAVEQRPGQGTVVRVTVPPSAAGR